MPLRIRRGTDAERLTITPAEGELIYTTDSKRVYVGDGTTAGGLELTAEASIDNLQTNLNLNSFDIVGTGNINITGDITVTGNLNGNFLGSINGDVVGSVFADNSSLLVDALTGTHYGLFDGNLLGNVTGDLVGNVTGDVVGDLTGDVIGDVTGNVLGNVNGNLIGNVNGSIFADDSSLLVDAITGTHYGTFDGDFYLSNEVFLKDNIVSILPTLSATQNEVIIASNEERSVFKLVRNSDNDLSLDNYDLGRIIFERNDLINGGVNNAIITGRVNELIFGHDTDGAFGATKYFRWQNGKLAIGKLVASTTLDVAGDGSFDGTVTAAAFKGSIVGDDSSMLVDAITGTHYGTFDGDFYLSNEAYLKNNIISILPTLSATQNEVIIASDEQRSIFRLTRNSTNDLTLSNYDLGRIIFERNDTVNGASNSAIITGRVDELIFGHDSTGAFGTSKYFRWQNGKLAIGKLTASTTLDVAGNGSFDGTVTAAAFKGSIMGDDSTTIVDGINGTITASGFIQFGSYTDAEIAEITPSNGMVYYNTTDNRFRGYQNGAWINLDDGTAA
jgi:Major tropism determinant N-terminal domain